MQVKIIVDSVSSNNSNNNNDNPGWFTIITTIFIEIMPINNIIRKYKGKYKITKS